MQAVTNPNERLSVEMYTSRPDASFVNSYLIDTKAGIVVIDTQFLISEANGLKEQLKATGKPLAAIFITHPHPDHFNGIGVLLEDTPDVPVYATQPTLDGIIAVEALKRAAWTPVYGADYPASTVFPNHIIRSGDSITIGGVAFHVEDIGEGETSNLTLIHLPATQMLFAGDLAYHRVHPWLVESHSQAWLRQLANVQQRYADVEAVHIGHGVPGTMRMLADQMEYITFFQNLVRQHQTTTGIAPDTTGRDAIVQATLERYPNWPLEALVGLNIDGIVAEHIA